MRIGTKRPDGAFQIRKRSLEFVRGHSGTKFEVSGSFTQPYPHICIVILGELFMLRFVSAP